MRILFLSDNFPPEGNAPATRLYEHATRWVRAGHEVTVITCAPNFPEGRLFAGYRNAWRQVEWMDGIRVVRVKTYITANEGLIKRTLDYLSFMLMATVLSLFERRPDVVVATSPQFFCALAGWMVGLLKRRPFVFELRDIWPESIRAVGAMKNSAVLDWLEKLELFLYRKAALVVSVTHSFRENLARRGIDPRKVAVVTNGIDTGRFQPRPRDEALAGRLGLGGKFVAGYVGTHGMAHGLETVLEAAALLKAQPGGDRFRFLLLGDGASKAALVAAASARGLDNVVFVDTVPKEEVASYWALLDASIIHLKRSDLFRSVIPSKLFECMGMGIPVLHGVEGESAAIVEREGVGLLFQPENAEDLCRRLRELADDPQMRKHLGVNGIEAAKHYDRKALAMKMLAQLEAIVAGKPLPYCCDESKTPAEYQFNR